MGWREEEKIANEIAWANSDITNELQKLREAQSRAQSSSTSHSPAVFSPKTVRKIVLTVAGILFGISILTEIVIAIIALFS